jgi:hypothetical protein
MGVNYNVYIGPFVIATYELRNVIEQSDYLICKNEGCDCKTKLYPPDKFCSKCGGVCEPVEVTYMDGPDWYELIGDDQLISWGESLDYAVSAGFECPTGTQFDTLILNRSEILNREDLDFDIKQETGFIDIEKINIEAEKTELLTICKEEIEILKEHYQDVIIKWGVIVWLS